MNAPLASDQVRVRARIRHCDVERSVLASPAFRIVNLDELMKHNGFHVTVLAIVALTAASLLSGCAWSVGGRESGETVVHPTQGQELIDLKRAKDQGALTDAEYENQKLKLLAR
jgi:hypothetical protein